MNLIVYNPVSVIPEQFVSYWSELYDYRLDESLYSPYVGKPLTPAAVRTLFQWKNGSELSQRKQRSVELNYIARLDELADLPRDTDGRTFLGRFSKGGAIWRIFWLHCWQPKRFPIYDQHVHRAMACIETHQKEEITGWTEKQKIDAYLRRYIPFYQKFAGIEDRLLDRALWAFGKFIKNSRLPEHALPKAQSA